MDLIRKILMKIEENESDDSLQSMQIDGFSDDQIAYNIYLLKDAGLIDGTVLFGMGSIKPQGYAIFRLNWKGHEFIDACRDEGRWAKAKTIFKDAGGVSFDVAKDILVQLMLKSATTILSGGAV